jgi:hypothetical protein
MIVPACPVFSLLLAIGSRSLVAARAEQPLVH